MNRAVRFVAILVSFALLFLNSPIVSALNLAERSTVVKQSDVSSLGDEAKYISGVDMASLEQLLYQGFFDYQSKVDISALGIASTTENQNALALYIYDEMSLAFFVDYVYIWRYAGRIIAVEPRYLYSKDVCLQMVEEYKYEAEHFVADLKGNTQISDVDKALLLHDRIAANCEFDLGDENGNMEDIAFNGYGVFAKGKAVCHGYSEAYDYLLSLVGIESELCRSAALNHTWNIVTVNGKKYHVDITWDDPVWSATNWDVVGKIEHRYFLVSSTKLDSSHVATDYDVSPVDTTYDNYFWNNSQAAFQLVGNKVYYIDNVNATLNCKTDGTVIRSVKDIWYAGPDSYWPKNYSYLGSNGEVLFISQADAILEYNPLTDVLTTAHIPELEEGTYNYIYGFTYSKGYFVYDINGSPNFGVPTMKRVIVPYDKILPTVSVSVSNNCAAEQTLNISFSDNIGVKGYYFGTAEDATENALTKVYESTARETVTESGTYYIAALDNCGNVSEPLCISFYKTELLAGEGSLDISTVLTAEGSVPQLPIPSDDKLIFVGWFTEAQGGVKVTDMPISADQTLYAHWQSEESIGDVNGDEFIDNVDAVVVLRYDCGIVEETKALLLLGDVNEDGNVNNLDAALILKYDAGLIEGF